MAKHSTGLLGPVKDTPLPLSNYRADEKQVTLENNYERNRSTEDGQSCTWGPLPFLTITE